MDVSSVLDGLNDVQRQAVSSPTGNLLVLAGAGSGKTRVLVHRIAWYIQAEKVSPFGILAVTFTNKAAAEMRSRIESLLKRPTGGMWVGTFHSITHRLLRKHWHEAKLPENFQIIDSDDQSRIIKRVMKTMDLDETQYSSREIQWFINSQKEEGLRPHNIESQDDTEKELLVRIYKTYQSLCERSGLVDFTELLLRAYELFRDNEHVLASYQYRFRHLLVDEFQDTNALQYAWLKLMVGQTGSLFAVGDDDQSIYSWRGALMENMQHFQKDFYESTLLRLEQNYRSTSNILNAANALIDKNTARLGKKLWTDCGEGEKIDFYAAYNEHDEAKFVVGKIADSKVKGEAYCSHAVLYRVGAQSRILEEQIMQAGIPYRVFGGMRFYERAEIKDALAYLRLVVFNDDDAAFERIVNTPARGIGQRTLEALRNRARLENISLWKSTIETITDKTLSERAINVLCSFIELITQMGEGIREVELGETMDMVIKNSGLVGHCRKEKGEKGLARIENMQELVVAATDFDPSKDEYDEMDRLSAFLAHVALESGETQAEAHSDFVSLMTLHSAKGLEFKDVYLVGLEEGLFPHQRNIDNLVKLEEERRLCYVGITRAKRKLTLTYSQHRHLHGSEYYPQPSRFLGELPFELLYEVKMGGGRWQPTMSSLENIKNNDTGLKLGQRVSHAKFGEGIVLNLEGKGGSARVQVNFEQVGNKWLVLAYANLRTDF